MARYRFSDFIRGEKGYLVWERRFTKCGEGKKAGGEENIWPQRRRNNDKNERAVNAAMIYSFASDGDYFACNDTFSHGGCLILE